MRKVLDNDNAFGFGQHSQKYLDDLQAKILWYEKILKEINSFEYVQRLGELRAELQTFLDQFSDKDIDDYWDTWIKAND